MQGSDVNRLLVTSSALLFRSGRLLDRVLRRLTPNVVEEAGWLEERTRSSSLDWTIARMGFLTNDHATSYRHAVGASPEGGGSNSRATVACFLLTGGAAIHLPESGRRAVRIGIGCSGSVSCWISVNHSP